MKSLGVLLLSELVCYMKTPSYMEHVCFYACGSNSPQEHTVFVPAFLLLPCLHFFQFPFLCQSVYSGDCFGRFLPLWLKSYSLTYIFSLFHLKLFFSVSLSDSMPAGRVSALRCLLTSPLLSFVSIHPFIPPSSQSLPVLPGGCASVGQWNDSVLCCFWDPAQAASASSLSSSCKTHQLLVSCAYNTYCLSGITWSLFVYDLLFNFCFLSFQ